MTAREHSHAAWQDVDQAQALMTWGELYLQVLEVRAAVDRLPRWHWRQHREGMVEVARAYVRMARAADRVRPSLRDPKFAAGLAQTLRDIRAAPETPPTQETP